MPTEKLDEVTVREIKTLEFDLSREHRSGLVSLATLEQEIYYYDDAMILREAVCRKQTVTGLKRDLSAEREQSKRMRFELQQGRYDLDDISQIEKYLLLSVGSEQLEDQLTELRYGNWELARRIMNQADGILPGVVLESGMWEVLTEEELEHAISLIRLQRKRLDRIRYERRLIQDADFQFQKKLFREQLIDSFTQEELEQFYATQLATARRRLREGLEGNGMLNQVNLRVAYRRLEEIDSSAPAGFNKRDETKILLALAAVELNLFDKAEEVLEALIDVIRPENPLYTVVVLQEMQLAFARRNYPPVVDLGGRILQRKEISLLTENRARYLAGLSAYLSGNPQEGREFLEGIRGRNSFYFFSRFYIALQEAGEGELESAADRLLSLLEELPSSRISRELEDRTKLALAYIYIEMDEPGTAFRLFQDIARGSPFEIAASYGTAWCLIALGHFEDAESQLQFCRNIGSGTVIEFEAVFTLIELFLDQKRFEEATDECLVLKKHLGELSRSTGSFGVAKEMQIVSELRDETSNFSNKSDSHEIREKTDAAVRTLNRIDSELYALTARLGGEIDPELLLHRADRLLAEIELARLVALREELGKISAQGASTHGMGP